MMCKQENSKLMKIRRSSIVRTMPPENGNANHLTVVELTASILFQRSQP